MDSAQTNHPIAIEILLVEDNPLDAELTQRALKRHHLVNNLVWIKDGAEALKMVFGTSDDSTAALSHIPKLILLDLKLPKVDGHAVLQQLKSDPRTKSIPVVVLTSSREEADLHRSYQIGTNSYIVKLVAFDSFVEAVRQLGLYWLLLNELPSSRELGTLKP